MMAFIMCAGEGKRWGDGKVAKQLIEVDGEPILHRTVRQLKEHGIRPTIVTANEELHVPGADHLWPDSAKFLTESIMSTRHLWAGRVAIFLGDVFYTDRAIRETVQSKGVKWFGVRYKSILTGKNCPEVWSCAFDADDSRIPEAFDVATGDAYANREYVKFPHSAGSLWQPYRYLIGMSDLNNTVSYDREIWHEINDFTCDFDKPEEFPNWHVRYMHRFVRGA